MKEQALLEKKFGNKTVKIMRDSDASSPREWDNLGEILYRKNNRYTLGDRECSEEELAAIAKDPANICLPVYAYIHSGTTLSTKPFGCRWDSGQCGIIFTTKEKIKKEWGVSRISSKLMKTVRDGLAGEIETFNQYINGEAIGFVIEDENGDHVDSCWGYYGMTPEALLAEAASEHDLEAEAAKLQTFKVPYRATVEGTVELQATSVQEAEEKVRASIDRDSTGKVVKVELKVEQLDSKKQAVKA